MTFEDYIRSQYYDPKSKQGAIDFTFRASVTGERVEIYVHPSSVSGDTTPTLRVNGDTIEWPKCVPHDGWDAKSFEELDRLSVRVGYCTAINTHADVELRRRGYLYDAALSRWVKPTED